jgi:GDP-4-dehydro-6-deoxy-D-mannose reductase
VILITGVGGFAGGHLAAVCAEQGAAVAGLGLRERPPLPALRRYDQVDLADADATRKSVAEIRPERVFHLAAEASVARSWEAPGEVITGNVASTLNLLEALRLEAPEVPVLVACSSEEYGPPRELPVTEEHPLSPRNPYAASKAMVDVLAESYADVHGMPVVRTRAFNHTGPGQTETYVVASFARQIAEAEAAGEERALIETGNLEVLRDFSDVRDVVRAYWLALEPGEAGVFNVCSGRGTAVSDILTGLAEHSRLALEHRTDPARVRDNEVMEIRGSHEKLTATTGWRPEIELAQTLRDTLAWWRERVSAEVGSR